MDPYEKYLASSPKKCCACGIGFSAAQPAITKEFTGEYYAFCSPACITTFETDPEKFVRVEEENGE